MYQACCRFKNACARGSRGHFINLIKKYMWKRILDYFLFLLRELKSYDKNFFCIIQNRIFDGKSFRRGHHQTVLLEIAPGISNNLESNQKMEARRGDSSKDQITRLRWYKLSGLGAAAAAVVVTRKAHSNMRESAKRPRRMMRLCPASVQFTSGIRLWIFMAVCLRGASLHLQPSTENPLSSPSLFVSVHLLPAYIYVYIVYSIVV